MLKVKERTGGHGFVCPLCGLQVRNDSAHVVMALWHMHLKSHDEDIVRGCEDLLRRCAP